MRATFSGCRRKLGVGLRRDAEGAPEHVEVVDVGRAEIDAQRLEDRLQRHVQHLRLVAIDVDVELRRAGGEGREHVADAGHLVGGGDEVVGYLLELAGRQVGAVLQPHREARLTAHAAHRRRDSDACVFDSSMSLSRAVMSSAILSTVSPCLARSRGIFHDGEDRADVAGVGARRARAPRVGGSVGDAGRFEDDLVGAAHDLVGPLQRGALRQLQRHRDDAAIHLGDEAGRRVHDQPAGGAEQHGVDHEHHGPARDDARGRPGRSRRQACRMPS